MVFKSLTALALALVPVHQSAMANGFVNNSEQWLNMTGDGRTSYVRGLNDSVNFVFVDDNLDAAIAKVGRTKCIVQLRLTPAMISDILTNAYNREDGAYNRLAPLVVYVSRLGEICRETINNERASFNLPPQ